MHPTGFASGGPEDVTPDDDDRFRTWRWTLVCADGALVLATVAIERFLADRWFGPELIFSDNVVEVVRTKGLSLILREVVGHDDRPLHWCVGRAGYWPRLPGSSCAQR